MKHKRMGQGDELIDTVNLHFTRLWKTCMEKRIWFKLEKIMISTVFLSLEHSGDNYFETMVFGSRELEQVRTKLKSEALVTHESIVNKYKRKGYKEVSC